MARSCSDLKPWDSVIFTDNCGGEDQIFSGTVLPPGANVLNRTVSVCYLYGYKDINTFIPFDKMLAVHDENAEMTKIGWYIGTYERLEDK